MYTGHSNVLYNLNIHCPSQQNKCCLDKPLQIIFELDLFTITSIMAVVFEVNVRRHSKADNNHLQERLYIKRKKLQQKYRK